MKLKFLTAILVSAISMTAFANDTHSTPIKTTPLNDSVYMLEGQGGNIAVIENDNTKIIAERGNLG